jgi:hypothetical protein
MDPKQPAPDTVQGIDLDAVQSLVRALESDLSQLRSGSGDVERLREEVNALKSLLNAPAPQHPPVRHALHGMRHMLDAEWDSAKTEAFKASRYVAEIGRILGL